MKIVYKWIRDKKTTRRNLDNVAAVRASVAENSNMLPNCRSQEVGLSRLFDFFKGFTPLLPQKLKPLKRRLCSNWPQERLENDSLIFWQSSFLIKSLCKTLKTVDWRSNNPHDIVENPFHSAKVSMAHDIAAASELFFNSSSRFFCFKFITTYWVK